MKYLKHIKSFNEATENLNISDVIQRFYEDEIKDEILNIIAELKIEKDKSENKTELSLKIRHSIDILNRLNSRIKTSV